MACYAHACRLAQPCASPAICEKYWHACEPPKKPNAWIYLCRDCGAVWHLHDSTWIRQPLNGD